MGPRHRRHGVGYASLLALLACAQAGGDADTHDPQEANVADPFVASLEVKVEADTVRLRFHVTNASDDPVTLDFSSSQRYDFVVARPGGGTVWSWSADRLFAQALGSETMAAGETLDFSAAWPTDVQGEFIATGMVTATNYTIEQRSEFRIP